MQNYNPDGARSGKAFPTNRPQPVDCQEIEEQLLPSRKGMEVSRPAKFPSPASGTTPALDEERAQRPLADPPAQQPCERDTYTHTTKRDGRRSAEGGFRSRVAGRRSSRADRRRGEEETVRSFLSLSNASTTVQSMRNKELDGERWSEEEPRQGRGREASGGAPRNSYGS